MGGMSGEHEVSVVSADSVMRALDKNKYEVIPIGNSKKTAAKNQDRERLTGMLAYRIAKHRLTMQMK